MFYLVYHLHFRSWKGHSAKRGCWIAFILFGPISRISKFKSSPLEAHSGKEINKLRIFWRMKGNQEASIQKANPTWLHCTLSITSHMGTPSSEAVVEGNGAGGTSPSPPSRHSLLIPHTQRWAVTHHCDCTAICNAPSGLRDQLTSYSDQNSVLPPAFFCLLLPLFHTEQQY